MGSINPNGQSAQEQVKLRAIWDAHPAVQRMTAECGAQIAAEALTHSPEGFTRAFAIVREWEQANGELPDSGIHATG